MDHSRARPVPRQAPSIIIHQGQMPIPCQMRVQIIGKAHSEFGLKLVKIALEQRIRSG